MEPDDEEPLVRRERYGDDDRRFFAALVRVARGKLDRGPAAPPKPYRPDGIAAKASRAAIRRRVLGGAGHDGL